MGAGHRLTGWVLVVFTTCCVVFVAYRRGEVKGRSTEGPLFQPAATASRGGDEAYLRVHVAGAVKQPGVYSFGPRERVEDALRKAGGPAPGARLNDLNLAAHLRDGMRLYLPGPHDGPRDEVVVVTEDVYVHEPPAPRDPEAVPKAGAMEPLETDVGRLTRAPAAGGEGHAGKKLPPARPIDLNTASLEELQQLPGVGPAMAHRILAWRTLHGRFKRADELVEVKGIGPKTYARMAPYVTVP